MKIVDLGNIVYKYNITFKKKSTRIAASNIELELLTFTF